jgi:glycosyltransferase involved in cell wall biosynthesis
VKYQSNTTCIKNYSLPDDILENTDWNNRSFELCYIGDITKVRGILEMINLIQGTNLKLNLAGLFENDKLFNTIKSLDGWRNVNYHGYVSREGVKKILRTTKIGLLILHPTQTHLYSLPIKLFEYMAAGLPIIASNFQTWKEIIEENECGYCIDPFDQKMLREKIEFIINNPVNAKQMGRNGRKAIEEKFNWEVEAKKLVGIYNNLSK